MIWIGFGLVVALIGVWKNDGKWVEWGLIFTACAVAAIFGLQWWSQHKAHRVSGE